MEKCIMIKRFFFAHDQNFSKVHKTDKKSLFQNKNTCLMIFNDERNCQVSTILIKPRSIHAKTLKE
jgi:hypothetical protein